jgi:RimJ/RimL family protein N-acetyltransferase
VLTPISIDNIPDFEDTSYAEMTDADKRRMVQESGDKRHDGAFFEMLSVTDGDQIVGFISLYAQSAHIIGIGPEIKKTFQGQGYGYRAEVLALEYARKKGFSIAAASVREENAASIALHEKLGFEIGAHCMSKHGNPVRIYIKAL